MPETDDDRDVLAMTTSDVLASDSAGTGASLRQERVRRGQTLAEISEETGLPQWMVEGLETEELSLDDAQNKAYLRIYAREIGLDAESLLRDLDGGRERQERQERPEPVASLSGPVDDAPDAAPATRLPLPRTSILVGLAVSAAVGALIGVLIWGGGPAVELAGPSSPTAPEEPAAPLDEPDEPDEPDAAAEEAPDSAAEEEPDTAADMPAARPPAETRVQVLHNGDEAAAEEVVATLEALGYGDVRMDTTLTEIERTTVLYVEGWEPEARALRARDDRFAEIAPNADYTADVDLHIEVGPDWTGAE